MENPQIFINLRSCGSTRVKGNISNSGSKRCRNFLVKHMWTDIEDRRRLLKTSTFWRKSDLKNLNEVFRNFFVNMDIGYLQSDLELAAIVYKWILNNHHKGIDGVLEKENLSNTHVDSTPEKTIEAAAFLVTYIRYHAKYLTELMPEDLLLERNLASEVTSSEGNSKNSINWRPASYFLINKS